ncbi:MAG: hypothetical protein WBO70_05250, partial [Erysipelotrichaceae bacterium]
MKKVFNRLYSLTLYQQLFFIVFGYLIVFSFLFFGYLGNNIDSYIQQQIYKMMSDSQQQVIFVYEQKIPKEQLISSFEADLAHIVYKNERVQYVLGQKRFVSNIVDIGKKELDSAPEEVYKNDFVRVFGDKTYYYSVYKNNDLKIVTIADTTYDSLYRQSLMDGVINVT